MIVELNPIVKSVRGRLGNIVFYHWKGLRCARAYCVPRNPDTVTQRKTRGRFADAVHAWQQLDEAEKHIWGRRARMRISGYNLFISSRMKINDVDTRTEATLRCDSSPQRCLFSASSIPLLIHSVSESNPRLFRSNPPPLVHQARLH